MTENHPMKIAVRLGELEDQFAGIQHEHVQVVESELLLKEDLQTMRHTLVERAEGDNAEQRKAWVERELRQSDDYPEWVKHHARRRALDKQQEYLEKRLSACQSQLKPHKLG